MALALVLLGGVVASGVRPMLAMAQQVSELRAAGPPTLALGASTALVWRTVDAEGRGRVLTAVPLGAAAQQLGPVAFGTDGDPAAAAAADGSTWVIASRRNQEGSRLWAQRLVSGRWQRAEAGPSAGLENEHPAVASGGDQIWVVWMAEGSGPEARRALYASRRLSEGWSRPEQVPGPSGEPMVPAIAVDDRGMPLVTWAASAGGHAEIWISWRGRGGWSPPLALTDDDTPDVAPSVAVKGDRWLVAWSSFRRHAYWIEAVTGHPEKG